jgi:hypothetical protein
LAKQTPCPNFLQQQTNPCKAAKKKMDDAKPPHRDGS